MSRFLYTALHTVIYVVPLVAALMLDLVPLAPRAHAAPAQSSTTPNDQVIIGRIQAYLEDLDTLVARFIQITPDEPLAQGDIFIKKPGRLRLTYDPPNPNLIIANGYAIAFFDLFLKTRSVIDLKDSPAYPLLADAKALSQTYRLLEARQTPGNLAATFISRTRPDDGQVTLLFIDEADRLDLAGWTILDANRHLTQITLTNLRYGDDLDEDLFSIYDVLPADS